MLFCGNISEHNSNEINKKEYCVGYLSKLCTFCMYMVRKWHFYYIENIAIHIAIVLKISQYEISGQYPALSGTDDSIIFPSQER
jgi:hypothetical protein